MKILITGAGGFIGSHLAEKCIELGYEVKAFIRYNSRNYWGWLENSKYIKEFDIFTGDIRDYDSVTKAMKGCNGVFHLAALIGIPYSYVSPLAYVKTNIEGTYNILEAAKVLDLEDIIITSTSETYGTARYVPIDEQHLVVGQSPYSASKIAADQLSISYYRSFRLPVKIVRPFNTYGPRQSARAIIPTVITQILSGDEEINVGNIHPTRDLTYVKDTINGFIEIFKSEELIGEIVNIGMNKEISIHDLIYLISDLIGKKIEIKSDEHRKRPVDSEVERLICNNQKLMTSTNWAPQYTLSGGLEETIDWINNNIKYYKSDIYYV
jgi:dTDP-glucose 4,6-dehydratase